MHKILNDLGELQAIIYHADQKEGRIDLVPSEEMLQVSISHHNKGTHPAGHYHNYKDLPVRAITAECWIIFKGKIQIEIYNDTNTIIHKAVLSEGDVMVTLFGGHTYKVLTDDTYVYEIKLGPYEGITKDKTII